MTYENILKAATGQNQSQTPAYDGMDKMPRQLSALEQSQNYETFSMLMREGVYLPDLLKRLEGLEKKVKNLESQPRKDTNAELFAVMEASVCADAEVRMLKKKLADTRDMIISEICMKDNRYMEAMDEYKTTVNRVYIRQKEQTSHGDGSPEICDDLKGCVSDKEGVSSEQKTQ